MSANSFILVGFGLALVWLSFEIHDQAGQIRDRDRAHTTQEVKPITSTAMEDSTMPLHLNEFLSRKDNTDGTVVPMRTTFHVGAEISDPTTIDTLPKGISANTGHAMWWVVRGSELVEAIEIGDFGSSTAWQGRDDPSTSWIGISPKLADNSTDMVFVLSFELEKADVVVFSMMFRATGATSIGIRSHDNIATLLYERDLSNSQEMGGTSRGPAESLAASAALSAGMHNVVVHVVSAINRPAVFWCQGTIAGAVSGNIKAET